MAIEFEDLRVFLATAEHGSLGRAAAALGLAQPSVSNRMAGLERRIGAALFSRSTRGATLTPAGERLLPHARRALQVMDDAHAAARTPDYRPPIRILVAASYMPVLLPVILETFESGGRPVSVSYDHGPNIIRALATGEADIGFVAPCPHPASVTMRSLGSSPVVAAVAPDHPLLSHGRVTVVDLGDYPVAFAAWGEGSELFLEHLPAHARVHSILPVTAAAQLARERGYVVVAPQAALVSDVRPGTLTQLPVADLPRATVALAVSYRREGTVPVAELITRVRRVLKAPDTGGAPYG